MKKIIIVTILSLICIFAKSQKLRVQIDSVKFVSYRKAIIWGHTETQESVVLKYGTDHAKQILRPGVWLSVFPIRGVKRGKFKAAQIDIIL